MTKTVVIVDAVSSGAKLATHFHGFNIDVIHVQTMQHAHDYYLASIRPDDFIKTFFYEDNFKSLCENLSPYELLTVIAGFDTGVALADRLNAHFQLPGNSSGSSSVRWNKYAQRQAMRAAGLFTFEAMLIEEKSALELLSFPFVLKPCASASAVNVFLCRTLLESENAFEAILNQRNDLGAVNDGVLCEPYFSGREFRVNTVSWKGEHQLTDVWDMTKSLTKEGRFLYEKADLILADDPVLPMLQDYIETILPVLGVAFGAASCDVMITEKGPVLIELGARLMGEIVPDAILRKSLPVLPYERLVKACVGQALETSAYRPMCYLYVHYVKSKASGYLAERPPWKAIRALVSVVDIQSQLAVGDQIFESTDYASIPAIIILQSTDRDQLLSDLKRVIRLEGQGLFVIHKICG